MSNEQHLQPRHAVRLPRFITDESVGLGQVVKRVTGSLGFRACRSCEERAARLDQWLRFSPCERGGQTNE